MRKDDYMLLRNLEKQTRYLTRALPEIKKKLEDNTADKELLRKELELNSKEVEDMLPVIESMKKILDRRKKLKKVFFWVVTIAFSAGLTTWVQNSVNGYMKPEVPYSSRNKGGKNVDLE